MGRFFIAAVFTCSLMLAQADVETKAARAAQAMRSNQFDEAERLYRDLLKAQPNNPGWQANLGLALHSQRRFAEAVQFLDRSVRTKPSAGLYAVLGVDYLNLNRPCDAVGPLEKTDRRSALADAYYGCKRYAEAARVFTLLGDTRRAARSWWQARDYAQAKPLYEKLASDAAGDPEFAYEFGDTLLRADGAPRALPWLEKARDLTEGRAALGKAYAELGRFSEAVPLLESAAQSDPDLLLPLSRAYKATGRAAEADRALNDYRKKTDSRSELNSQP